jgi:hypothetical protein
MVRTFNYKSYIHRGGNGFSELCRHSRVELVRYLRSVGKAREMTNTLKGNYYIANLSIFPTCITVGNIVDSVSLRPPPFPALHIYHKKDSINTKETNNSLEQNTSIMLKASESNLFRL